MLIPLTQFKVSVCWVFIAIHLHIGDVTFFWRCCRVHLNESVCDWLPSVALLQHDDGDNDDDEHSDAADGETDHTSGAVSYCCIPVTEHRLQYTNIGPQVALLSLVP